MRPHNKLRFHVGRGCDAAGEWPSFPLDISSNSVNRFSRPTGACDAGLPGTHIRRMSVSPDGPAGVYYPTAKACAVRITNGSSSAAAGAFYVRGWPARRGPGRNGKVDALCRPQAAALRQDLKVFDAVEVVIACQLLAELGVPGPVKILEKVVSATIVAV